MKETTMHDDETYEGHPDPEGPGDYSDHERDELRRHGVIS